MQSNNPSRRRRLGSGYCWNQGRGRSFRAISTFLGFYRQLRLWGNVEEAKSKWDNFLWNYFWKACWFYSFQAVDFSMALYYFYFNDFVKNGKLCKLVCPFKEHRSGSNWIFSLQWALTFQCLSKLKALWRLIQLNLGWPSSKISSITSSIGLWLLFLLQ